MSIRRQPTLWLAVGVAWSVISGMPAVADDTELFIQTSTAAGQRPNILLVIDNSISMAEDVQTQATFDGSGTYADANGCVANRVYWVVGEGVAPTCDTTRWFSLSNLQCQAALTSFQTTGQHTAHLGGYDTSSGSGGRRWEPLVAGQNRVVECQDDVGIHGNGGAGLYARNGGASAAWGNPPTSGLITSTGWTASPFNNDYVTLYSGKWMNWQYGPTTNRPRIDVMKEVANNLLDTINGVNVGLVTFNQFVNDDSRGGYVARAMGDISTTRAGLKTAINALAPEAATPLSETLYESARYFRGQSIDYGNPATVAGARSATNVNNYASPIAAACQKNFVILLTDGEPRWDEEGSARIRAMTDASGASFTSLVGNTCDVETYPAGFSPSGGECLDDLAEFLYDGDFSPLAGQQNIGTYTVGFTVDLPILRDTATRGHGRYYTANDTATLASSLQQIMTSILQTNITFTAPTVAVNAFNRTQNLSDLFVSVFRPAPGEHWPGNLKKYRLRTTDGQIVDVNGNPAIDPVTGFFADTAQEHWSATVDGKNVEAGGAANLIPTPVQRVVYTHLSGAGADLTLPENRVAIANTILEDNDFATPDDGWTRENVIDFINGQDLGDADQNNVTAEPRTQLGDPLHSQPVSMVYGPGLRDGLIFSATNDGFLHAFDMETGIEVWSFIPEEFLPDQVQLLKDDPSATKHYGIDGDLALQVVADNDGIIDSDDEKVYLFFGMRRGGDFYYGLDVTVPTAPRLLWRIDSATLPGLGQSWSTPIPTKVTVSGATQNDDHLALVIGGGYEPDQDNDTPPYTDTTGNSIYIVDSERGTLLWHGGKVGTHKIFATLNRAMDYSIPADVRVVDFNGDGFADRLYAGDMGGQVWRLDITNGATAANLVAGGVIAQLGAAPAATPALSAVRRFYYAPDVARINTRLYDFVHIGIGSGSRGHPLGTSVQDRFYALRDYRLTRMTQVEFDGLTPITDASLTPITTTNTSVAQGAPGWRLNLTSGGEKVLAEARTIDNEVVFTTFRPGTSAVSCTPQLGTNRIYKMSVFNGAPVNNLDGSADSTNLTMSDLYVQSEGAPLPAAQLIFLDGDINGDGVPDSEDDTDGDGIPDSEDEDYDGDGVVDDEQDTDGDGTPDHSDDDIDGDGVPNGSDTDIDGDGIANASDPTPNGGGRVLGGGAVLVVGLMSFPQGYRNDPVRTFWSQESIDD